MLTLGVAPLAAQAVDTAFAASDGGTVYATVHPVIGTPRGVLLAFHQAGANGEAEYGPSLERLTAAGFEVVTVDLRSGGDRFGGRNRTVDARGGSTGYCEALPDLFGAIAWARRTRPDLPIVLSGSSFSAALVIRAAAARPDDIRAVLSFSPASGDPMAGCRPEEVLDDYAVPTLAVRPPSEAAIPAIAAQLRRLAAAGVETYVAEHGVHGASILVEDRVHAPVEATWRRVLDFLEPIGR
jgi:alpha-beta hydrolase superfamily lysophospholipase